MAAGYELVILSGAPETPQELQQAVGMLQRLSGPEVYYLSSLVKNAISLVMEVGQLQPLTIHFTSCWDPRRTPESIPTHQIPNNDELRSYAQHINAHYEDIDFDSYSIEETEADYKARLRTELRKSWQGRVIVITTKEVHQHCIEILTNGQFGSEAIMTIWQMKADSVTNTFSAVTFDDLQIILNPFSEIITETQSLYPSVERPKPLDFPQTESLGSVNPPQSTLMTSSVLDTPLTTPPVSAPGSLSLLEDLLSNEALQLLDAFNSQLAMNVTSSQALSAVNFALNNMQKALKEQQENMMKDAEDLQKDGNIVEEVKTGFQTILEGQKMVETELNSLYETVIFPINQLKDRLAVLETLEKTSIPPKPPLVTIQSYFKKPGDFSLFLSISTRKMYPVWGFLQIFQGENFLFETASAVPFNNSQELNLSEICALHDGNYQILIVHFLDKSPISNLFQVVVENGGLELTFPHRHFQYSMVYKTVPNIKEIEGEVREQEGEQGVARLQTLAAQWQNEDSARVMEFIEIVREEKEEQQARKRLADRGFQL